MSVYCKQVGTGNSARLHVGSAVVDAYPFTIAGWAKPNAAAMTLGAGIAAVSTAPPSTEGHSARFSGATAGDPVRAASFIGGASGIAATTAGFSQDTWTHFATVFAAADSRTAYIDGGDKGTDATSKAIGTLVDTFIGAHNYTDATFDGYIGFVGIWDIALSDGEVASLADGAYPDAVQAEHLVWYCMLVEDGTEEIDNQQLTDYSVGPQWFPDDNPLDPGGEWTPPDGFTDPEGAWSNEANAYDDDDSTYAQSWVHASNTSEWLYLTLSTSLLCNKVRFNCNRFAEPGIEDSDVQIDVYYEGGWHTVYNDNLHIGADWRSALLGGTKTIEQARIRMTNSSVMDADVKVYELQFWTTGIIENPIPVFISPNVAAAPGGSGAEVTLTDIGLFSIGAPSGIDADNNAILVLKDADDNTICEQIYSDSNPFPTEDYDALGNDLTHALSIESPASLTVTRTSAVSLPEFWIVFIYLRDGHRMCAQCRVSPIS